MTVSVQSLTIKMPLKSIVGLLYLLIHVNSLQLVNDNVKLNLIFNDNGSLGLSLTLDDVEKISGEIGEGTNIGNVESSDCEGASSCFLQGNGVNFTINSIDSGFEISWQTSDVESEFQDCLDLKTGEINWFGGPEKFNAEWPVESSKFIRRAYVPLKSDNGGVAERYWLNSLGGYIFVQDEVPLFLDQNSVKSNSICFIASLTDPYLERSRVFLTYSLVAKNDPKEAQLNAVNTFLKKPKGHPDEWIIRNPIWTTWAKYKKDIDDETVRAFANDIFSHGYTGQIEIDDYWETCYGSLTFGDKFVNINETVQALHDLNFTVSLWTHPFVNHDCVETMTYGQEHGYFVKSVDGNDQTSWWDGGPAHYIDFTNEEARKWFTDRIQLLKDQHGIDSFKFDAGESDYPPAKSVVGDDVELSPGAITSAYVRTCATFGDAIEVRSAWRTQDLPIYLRMLDKDSRWTLNNGLHSLITSLLQLNTIGYTLVLPDMIGGNGYNSIQPTAELLIRWTQANTFMPTMQFSYLPWEITSDEFDGAAIVKNYVTLHQNYSDYILEAMGNSITNGVPVNPPIWWVDPTNPDALKVNDQYMLGEKILVAPVIEEGATERDIYLPKGTWVDGQNGELFEGPQTLKAYSSPIDVLPYFIKQ